MSETTPAKATRSIFIAGATALVLAAGCSTTGRYANSTASGIGRWNVIEHKHKLLLQMTIEQAKGGSFSNQIIVAGTDVGMPDGLTGRRALHFTIRRDAGAFECEGRIHKGVALGAILSFQPNGRFLQSDRSLSALTDRDLMLFALFDVNPQTVVRARRRDPSATAEKIVAAASRERFAKTVRDLGETQSSR
jgi:hypothetical protein